MLQACHGANVFSILMCIYILGSLQGMLRAGGLILLDAIGGRQHTCAALSYLDSSMMSRRVDITKSASSLLKLLLCTMSDLCEGIQEL